MPSKHWNFFKENGGKPFQRELLPAAAHELDELARVLEGGWSCAAPMRWIDDSFQTPDFGTTRGLYCAMPRDLLLVVGDDHRGADGMAQPVLRVARLSEPGEGILCPRSALDDGSATAAFGCNLLPDAWRRGYDVNVGRSVIAEQEPLFDAADFCRIGRGHLLPAQPCHKPLRNRVALPATSARPTVFISWMSMMRRRCTSMPA